MEEHKNHQKVSAIVVILFVLSIFGLIGLLIGDFTYGRDPFYFILQLVVGLLLILASFYARKRAIRRNLSGLKMGKFAFIAFIVTFVITTVGSLILMPYLHTLTDFANNQTASLFTNNFEGLKNNSTAKLKTVLDYPKTIEELSKKFEEVGAVKSCTQDKYDYADVAYGLDGEVVGFEMRLGGDYSIRCVGENKPFDVMVSARYEGGRWLVDDYTFDTELEEGFDANADDKETEE